MSTAVNDSKSSLNKLIAIGLGVFGIIEAVLAYILVIGPLYVKPVYAQAAAYNEAGTSCIVKLFGKTFASTQELLDNQIILSMSGTVLNIILIYLILTGSVILLALFFYKGFAFAKSYLVAIFGAKVVIGLCAILVPFANIRNTMRVFGVVDAVLCLAVCAYFVYLNSVEYADDMLFTDAQISAMKSRAVSGVIMFLALTVAMIFESQSLKGSMPALGGNWSLQMGWLNDTSLAQGAVMAGLVAVGLVAAIVYVNDADWAEFFFFSFGAATAVADLIGIIKKATSTGVGKTTIFLIIAFVAAAALAAFSFMKISKKLSLKVDAANKKASIAVLISVGSIVLSFVLMLVANLVYDKQLYSGSPLGAMDYMFFIVYGGLTLFLAVAMLGGYSFTKFGTLALYLFVASNAFENVFVTFSARSA
ncbi:MAG: hypothetical protein ACI4Q4_05545, partial [Oscillospiraceae bacterium]